MARRPGPQLRKAPKALATKIQRLVDEISGEIDARLTEAQSLAFDAMDAATDAERLELAGQVLRTSPFCADGWALLASLAGPESDLGLSLLREAVLMGKAGLGAQCFEDMAGDFWGLIETRPYMRARAGLAVALWHRGAAAEAASHLRDLLRLNPNDNQGLRYLLAPILLSLDLPAELEQLLGQYDEDAGAFLPWTAALHAFRCVGRTAGSSAKLADAMRVNRHVAPMLLAWADAGGKAGFPQADVYADDSPAEAAIYLQDSAALWAATPGALDWLRVNLPPAAAPRKPATAPRTPRSARPRSR